MTVTSVSASFGFVEARPRDIRIAVGAVDEIEEGEEDPVVAGEVGVEHHVEQADVLRGRERPRRRRRPAARTASPLVSRMRIRAGQPFGDEDVSARQKRQAPRRLQVVDERRDLEGRRRVIRRARLLGKRGALSFFSVGRVSIGWPSTVASHGRRAAPPLPASEAGGVWPAAATGTSIRQAMRPSGRITRKPSLFGSLLYAPVSYVVSGFSRTVESVWKPLASGR